MSQPPRWLSIVVLSAAAILGAEQVAEACACPSLLEPPVVPEDGALDVPLNTRIWVSADLAGSPEQVSLVDHDAQTMHLESTALRVADDPTVAGVHAFAVEGLKPQHRYSIKVGATVVSVFTTGAGEDTVPPALPVVIDRDRTIDASGQATCPGPTYLATFVVDHEVGLLLVDRDGTASIDPNRPEGLVTTLSSRRHVSIGRSPCFENWPEAAEAARTQVRFGAYDLAGNFSGWTEYEPVLIQPENEPLACKVGGDSGDRSGWLLLAGVMWVFARRRS